MASNKLKCHLRCLSGLHENIDLMDQTKIIIGRNPVTKIKDARCSKNQVELTADFANKIVRVKQLGANASRVSGTQLNTNEEAELKHGDKIEILLGLYPHIIEFVPINSYVTDEERAHKRIKLSEDLDDADSEEQQRIKEIELRLKKMKEAQEQKSKSDTNSITKNGAVTKKTDQAKKTDCKPCEKSIWTELDSLIIFTSINVKSSTKIAAFDMDYTLICTKSGKVFPTGPDDWKILYPEIKKKLKQLLDDNYKLVIFSNQRGLSTGKTNVTALKNKVEKIISTLDVPMQAFLSYKNDIFRKPAPGMWNYLIEQANDGIEVDLTQSFYVGDAAGREAKWALGKKKDFSTSDRLFAYNMKLPFHTPEEFFLSWKAVSFKMPEFDPRQVSSSTPLCSPATSSATAPHQEVVILVGYPASGKSFFSKHHMIAKGYTAVNRDTMGTWQKCVSTCKDAIKNRKSVVVDNTNPDKESRKRYIDCAREANIPCRCFYFTATIDQCKHNNKFRTLTEDKSKQTVNDMIINSFKSKLEVPSLSEGFDEILKINFVPNFKNPELEKLYRMFLV